LFILSRGLNRFERAEVAIGGEERPEDLEVWIGAIGATKGADDFAVLFNISFGAQFRNAIQAEGVGIVRTLIPAAYRDRT